MLPGGHDRYSMCPDFGAHLQRFLQSYHRFKCYFLMPAAMAPGGAPPELLYGHDLMKRELALRQAWEIGNDPDGVAIQPDDTPIVPAGQKSILVLAVLERKRAKEGAVPADGRRKAALLRRCLTKPTPEPPRPAWRTRA